MPGQEAKCELEYYIDEEKKDQGLFVIIRQKRHKVMGTTKITELNYDKDVEALIETFNLKTKSREDSSDRKWSDNLMYTEDLTHEPRPLQDISVELQSLSKLLTNTGLATQNCSTYRAACSESNQLDQELKDIETNLQQENDQLPWSVQYRIDQCIDEIATHRNNKRLKREGFDKFIEKVCNYNKKHRPTFVIFVLMSHGAEDGHFLLSGEGRSDGRAQGRCCWEDSKHKLTGRCHYRHLVGQPGSKYSGIIDPVCREYKNVPKIFIIQTCRGTNMDKLQTKTEADPQLEGEHSDIELFIPNYSDTLVFHACIDKSPSFVPDAGSLFIGGFCNAIRELQEKTVRYKSLLDKISVQAKNDSAPKVKNGCAPEDKDGSAPKANDGFATQVTGDSAPKAKDVFATQVTGDSAPKAKDGAVPKAKDDTAPKAKDGSAPKAKDGSAAKGTDKSQQDANTQSATAKSSSKEASPGQEELGKLLTVVDWLEKRQEDVIGGWTMNVCQRTTDLVSGDKDLFERNYTQQQPHVSSSLHKKLSLIKILQTQKPAKDAEDSPTS